MASGTASVETRPVRFGFYIDLAQPAQVRWQEYGEITPSADPNPRSDCNRQSLNPCMMP